MTWRITRRVVAAVIGGTVLVFGFALLFLPGPGSVIMLAGLGVLATEFVWARRILRRAREQATEMGRAAARWARSSEQEK